MNTAAATPRSSASIWLQALRPFSYTASMIPISYGAAWAVYQSESIQWNLFALVIIASFCIHAATNLVSEYFDYVKGVDQPQTLGGSRVLVEHLLQPRQVLIAGLFCFAVTAAIGLFFIYLHGWPILALGVIGLAGGFFYTAMPVGYKYWGMGDLMVFWLMGPLMAIGSFFVLTGTYTHTVLLTSLPIGCLVAAILSGNNLRDIPHDTQAGIKTTAGLLGHRWARIEYSALIAAAYAIVIVMIAAGRLPLWSLLVLLTLPLAFKNIRSAMKSSLKHAEQIAMLDQQTAALHLAFGLLLILSVLLGAFF